MRIEGGRTTDTGRSGAAAAGPPATRSVRASVIRSLTSLFGMPDYARYLAHQHAHHPGEAVLSEREFVRAEFERKYGEGPTRCC